MASLERIKHVITDPKGTIRFCASWLPWNLLGEKFEIRLIRKLTGVPPYRVREVLEELRNSGFWQVIAEKIPHYIGQLHHADVLYSVVRLVRPRIMIETGVAAGVSSAYILKAMELNQLGELHSIDLPNYEATYLPRIGIKPESILPGGAEPGFVIPDELRRRWHLSLGDSREVLPDLLGDLGGIDMSLHDSEHTYECMMFEYSTVFPRLNAGGIVMSDDVHLNSAFLDFCRKEELKPVLFEGRFGAAKKLLER